MYLYFFILNILKACSIFVHFFAFTVRKPVTNPGVTSTNTSTIALNSNSNNTLNNSNSPPRIVHPPHLYTNQAATVIHQHPGSHQGVVLHHDGHDQREVQPQPPAYHHSSETATYVNVMSPQQPTTNTQRPPFYHHPPPPMIRPQVQPHPGSGGHVPYSPAFQHHPHVRPVGIAIPRQGNTNPETYHGQSAIGKLTYVFFLSQQLTHHLYVI